MVRSKQAISNDNSPSNGGTKVQMTVANRGLRTYSQSQYRNTKKRDSIVSSAAFTRLGQQESLKHDKMMKLRKHQQHVQQLRSPGQENCKLKSDTVVLKGSSKEQSASPLLVKRSANQRKAAAAQSEGERSSPKDDSHSTSGLLNGIENVTGGAKLKIDVEFEDTDEDEENEGLKKVMENIDKDLNVAEDVKKGSLMKRPQASIASTNENWVAFGDKSGKKLKGISRTDAVANSDKFLTKLKENGLKDLNGEHLDSCSVVLEDVEIGPSSEVSQCNDTSRDMKGRFRKKVSMKNLCKGETSAVKISEVSGNCDEQGKDEDVSTVQNSEVTDSSRERDVVDQLVTVKDNGKAIGDLSQTLISSKGEREGSCKKFTNDDEACDKRETILNLQLEVSDELDPRTCDSNDEDENENEDDGEGMKVRQKDDVLLGNIDGCVMDDDPSNLEQDMVILENSEELTTTDTSLSLTEGVSEKKSQQCSTETTSKLSLQCVGSDMEVTVKDVKSVKRKKLSDCEDNSDSATEKKLKGEQVKEEFKATESSHLVAPSIMAVLHEDKKKEPRYRLTKSELEMLVICKVSEFFTDANKSEIGVLRRRCEQFDKIIDQWRRKANLYQKQITDLQIALQRAQTHRRFMGQAAPKPPMRSVGLQVQLTRYVHTDSSKIISRSPSSVHTPKQNVAGQHLPSYTNHPIVLPKQVAGSHMAFVTNLGATGALNGTTLVTKGTPITHMSGSSSTPNVTATKIRPTVPMMQKPSGTPTKSPSSQVGQVSLLQPRASTGVVITTQLPTAHSTSGGSGTISGSSSKLRTALDPAKMNASNATPVPMRLVPNQAITRQLAPASSTTSAASSTVTNANSRAVTVSMIGQPPLVTNAVKIIDLTADEEESAKAAAAAAAAAAASASASTTSLSSSSSGTGVNPVSTISNVAVVSSSLPSGSNTVTMLTPATSGNQILTLASPVGGMVTGSTTATTQSHIRMAQPVRAGNASIVNSGQVRLAYLMSPTSMVTMVRPNQPLFVAPSPGVRPGQPSIMRPALPTIVLQRGTTLLPLQQSQVTSLPNLRPATTTQSARVPAPAVVPVSVIGAPTVIRPALTTTSIASSQGSSSTSIMNVATAMVSPTPQITYSRTTAVASSPLQTTKNATITKTVVTPQLSKHPAPLPSTITYPEVPGRKALPSKPTLRINKVTNGIVLSWNMTHTSGIHAEISSYQLFAYQEGSAPPSTQLWKKVGDVKALPLPMACTLTQFMEGHKYYFAVRAMDVHNRLGPLVNLEELHYYRLHLQANPQLINHREIALICFTIICHTS